MGCLNCGYICSGAGLSKLATVILGLITTSCYGDGYRRVAYFHGSPSAAENCVANLKAARKRGESPDPCPEEWMLTVPGSCAFICFCVSAILLIILLCVELNKNDLFCKLDMIYHYSTGVCQVVLCGFVIAYAVIVLTYHPCDAGYEDDKKRCREDVWVHKFAVWHFVGAAIFNFFSALAYCGTGPLTKPKK